MECLSSQGSSESYKNNIFIVAIGLLTRYYPASKITNGYPWKTRGARKTHRGRTGRPRDARDERLPKLVFCVDCTHYFLPLLCILHRKNSYRPNWMHTLDGYTHRRRLWGQSGHAPPNN